MVISSKITNEAARRYLLAHMLGHVADEGSLLHRSHRRGLLSHSAYERRIHVHVMRRTIPGWLLEMGLAAGRYADDIAAALRVPVYALASRVRVMTPAERYAMRSQTRQLLWPTEALTTPFQFKCGGLYPDRHLLRRRTPCTGHAAALLGAAATIAVECLPL